ncbi:MAG: bifunctional acetate--CoA ligase family protein/GNAT family N-acetyltransferase [Burkholderiales bacterium]|nr:bifunctional acetate--CoA ligase family protein/GNAT family N-acetyltransferase [Burkholderiales bacterium]
MPPNHYLEPLFAPASLAVVGAGQRADSLAAAVYRNLRDGGFCGPVHAVNPKYTEIAGAPCYPALAALPQPVDLAVVVTPAPAVAGVLRDAARAGIHHALVLTAGFGEAGAAGRALEAEVAATARAHRIRMIGPNCLGLMRPSIGLNATFARHGAIAGHIALVAQSGAVCAALTDWAHAAGIGFSSVVSMGAGTDLDFGEILDYLLFDEATHSILLYVEGIHDARAFIGGLRAASRSKPIVVQKVGRHRAGSRAAMSHTGALVGNDAVFAAALRRCGVVRAETYMELFSAARLLAAGRLPAGNRLAFLTNGGGPGVMAADCAAARHVEVARLGTATLAALDAALPPHWSHGDPVDIIGDATPQRFADALGPLLADPGVDGVLTLFCPQIVTTAIDAANAILPLAKRSAKPVLTAWLGEAEVREGRAAVEAAGMPAFQSPESGVIGFAALAEYRHAQELLLEAPPPHASPQPPDLDAARALARGVAARGAALLSEPESKALLACFGIPVPPTEVVADAAAAAAAAQRLGYPLALKIVSPDIAHKSDVQGVTLNVRDDVELQREFDLLVARVRSARPQARLDGVALQPMVEKRFGRELMVGVAPDPVFGQVISFGAGGVAVELLRDNAIGLPPLNERLAGELIDRTRIARLLGHYRHIPAADRDAIVDVLMRVSDMVCACPWIREMDINPLSVDQNGAVALDARVVIDAAAIDADAVAPAGAARRRYAHLAIHPYPSELERREALPDGGAVLLRPIRPEDAAIELAFVEALSDHSRYMRFFNPTKTLSPRLLARLTQIDYEREMALIALDDGGVMRGVARYSPMSDGVSCEFAVTVADDWQGRGLASLMMRCLIDCARATGYERIVGSVLGTNHNMHRLMARLGFAVRRDDDDPAVLEFSLALAADAPAAA